MPPGLTHCRSATPPDDVRNISVTTFPSPAALNEAVRLKLGFFVICGVPMKCGDAAAASIGAISSKADDATIAAAELAILLLLLHTCDRSHQTQFEGEYLQYLLMLILYQFLPLADAF